MIDRKAFHSSLFKIDSCLKTYKMKRDPVQLINVGINTDPLSYDNPNTVFNIERAPSSHAKLRARDDVQHVHITNSAPLHSTYHFGEVLGQGSFGTVLTIIDKNDNKVYAMKVIPKTIVSAKMKAIRRELQILKMIEHPHIIHLYRVFESNTRIYLMLEKCTGELGKVFRETKPFSESDTKTVITQLAGVVDFLHKNDIVHRDLKLENILLADNPADTKDNLYIKVTDFGLGIIKGNYDEMLHERCGTLTYLSPEVITKGSYSHQCDIWSMGVIMYLLLWGKFPFFSISEQDIMHLICFEEPDYSSHGKLSQSALHLLNKMLTKDPAQRITAAEVRIHAWIEGEPLDENKHRNVLDLMKIWRSDMMLPKGTDCDWVSKKLDKANEERATSGSTTPKPIDKDRLMLGSHSRRQSMKIPIHNIHFDRNRRRSTKDENSIKTDTSQANSNSGKKMNSSILVEKENSRRNSTARKS